jgi:hypothetical protein
MGSKSFNKTSIQRLENYLGLKLENNSGMKVDLLSEKMSKDNPPLNEEIRSLITRAERKYNSEWRIDRENSRRDNEGRVAVGQESPLTYMMQEKILDHALPSALDKIAETLSKRRTANFSAFDESAYDIGTRKLSNATAGLISNGANYLVKYPIMAGLGGIAIGAIFAESGIRAGLTCLSCLGYGALKIAEKFESTNFARKVFGNNEFEIQRAQQSVGSAITNLVENHYTLGAIDRNFFSNGSQQSAQKSKSTKNLSQFSSQDTKNKQIVNKSYFEARISGDGQQLERAEQERFQKELIFQQQKEVKKREQEEEVAKRQKKSKPQPSQLKQKLNSPNRNPGPTHLLGGSEETKISLLRKDSPPSRYSPVSPPTGKPPLRGSSDSGPGPRPSQPLSATQTYRGVKGPARRP